MDVLQGDIFWVDIPVSHTEGSEQHGRRPFIVMSRTGINRRLNTVVVVPMTTFNDTATNDTATPESLASQPPFRIMIPVAQITKDLTCSSVLSLSVAKTDQARVIDKSRLGPKIGRLSHTATVAVGVGLANVFDIR
jgi:mRNA-degrading endonuclease toxin of MazEF toxin-antitoxin module